MGNDQELQSSQQEALWDSPAGSQQTQWTPPAEGSEPQESCEARPYTGPTPDQAPDDVMGPNGGLELLKFGAGFIPGVGTGLDSQEAGSAFKEGNYGEGAYKTAGVLSEEVGVVEGMASFFTSDMQDHSSNPDTGLTKQQEDWMYKNGAQSIDK